MPFRFAVAALSCGLVFALPACGSPDTDPGDTTDASEPLAPLQFNRDAQVYADALAGLDEQIEFVRARVEANPDSWKDLEWLANLHMERARISGSYDDYAAADEAIEQAFEIAPAGLGPLPRPRLAELHAAPQWPGRGRPRRGRGLPAARQPDPRGHRGSAWRAGVRVG